MARFVVYMQPVTPKPGRVEVVLHVNGDDGVRMGRVNGASGILGMRLWISDVVDLRG